MTLYSAMTVVGMALLLSSCEPAKPSVASNLPIVSGKVYLGEQLVNYGNVAFVNATGKAMRSVIYPDGTYNIRHPPLGEMKIVVMTGNPPVPAAAAGAKSGPPPNFKLIVLPESYNSEETTPLRYTVKEGQQSFDIKMQAEAKPSSEAKKNEPEKK